MGELGEQCSERYARPRSRLTSNTRRFVGGIPAERERESGEPRKDGGGIREMQIKGKFSATRANFAVYISAAFLGTTTVAS